MARSSPAVSSLDRTVFYRGAAFPPGSGRFGRFITRRQRLLSPSSADLIPSSTPVAIPAGRLKAVLAPAFIALTAPAAWMARSSPAVSSLDRTVFYRGAAFPPGSGRFGRFITRRQRLLSPSSADLIPSSTPVAIPAGRLKAVLAPAFIALTAPAAWMARSSPAVSSLDRTVFYRGAAFPPGSGRFGRFVTRRQRLLSPSSADLIPSSTPVAILAGRLKAVLAPAFIALTAPAAWMARSSPAVSSLDRMDFTMTLRHSRVAAILAALSPGVSASCPLSWPDLIRSSTPVAILAGWLGAILAPNSTALPAAPAAWMARSSPAMTASITPLHSQLRPSPQLNCRNSGSAAGSIAAGPARIAGSATDRCCSLRSHRS